MADKAPEGVTRGAVDRLIAVGASAGGLDALERFFGSLPDDPDAAFVVVQHLSPDYKSMMDSLLARHTSMPVEMAAHDQALRVRHVYLIPPGKTMTLEDGRLKLAPKPPNQLVLPIDVFLRSAAAGFRERLVAVILSGTGSDGSRGATAVKDAGGYVIAQNPETSRFDGMPRSAIATGIVDAVLDVESMGAHLATHLAMPLPSPAAVDAIGRGFPSTEVELLDELLRVLHEASGIAFRDYKPSTLHRRILRRMHMCGCDTLQAYVDYVRARPEEIHALQRDLLIPVTMFFRDPDAFEAVRMRAVLPIVQASEPGRPIRVWVAGCATGEEAYSIAMMVDEASSELRRWPTFKLFATDAEEHCLATASAGFYPRGIADEVDEQRLARFFDAREDGFAVRKELRQNLVFARHNVVEDPPFTQIDLICCRNLLIYLKPEAQERVLRRFQYALRPGGFLFLGSSETLGPVARDFEVVDARSRLYRMRHGRSSALSGGATAAVRARTIAGFEGRPGVSSGRTPDGEFVARARELLFTQYTPPTLLLGERLELIDVFGDVRDILAFREGGVSLEAPGLLPPQVAPLVKMLAHRVAKDLEPARVDQVALGEDSGAVRFAIVMRPLSRALGPWPMLATFERNDRWALAESGATIDLPAESSLHIQTLEHELAHTRDNLQATIEELETANEELQATNEELMATNEELQSTNEELQSVNEELYAVNAENQERIELLNRANLDLDTLSRATRVPTVFLDADLLLTRFTLEATQLFGFRETDIGRSIDEFSSTLDYPQFHEDLHDAVMHGTENIREVPARDGRWFQVRVLACAAAPGVPSRALATFLDITSLRNVHLLQSVLDSLPEHVAVLDAGGVIRLVNAAWRRFAADNGGNLAARSDIGRSYLAVCEPTSDDDYAQKAFTGLRDVLDRRSDSFSLRYPCHSPTAQRWFLMHVRPLRQPGGGAVVSHVDVSAWGASPE
jgi:two-component system CheB/CheR fusion protein